jgi:hypothetical protein
MLLDKKYYNFLNNKYNILGYWDLVMIDQNFDLFEHELLSTRKECYNLNDFYIIVHGDTDYYLPHCSYGLSIFNLVRSFMHVDISLSKLIFITNHYGIKSEFEQLIPEGMQDYNFPKIIDNSFSHDSAFNFDLKNTKVDLDSIQYHGLSMMNVNRIHRNILFNHLQKNNLLDRFLVSYTGKS